MIPRGLSRFLAFASLLALSSGFLEVTALTDVGAHSVFYCYVPTSAVGGELHVVGLTDNTKVWILDITEEEPKVVQSGVIDRLEDLVLRDVPFERYFKVVSNRRAVAQLRSVEGSAGSAFFPGVGGSFVGKEFILRTFGTSNYHIFAVDASHVAVQDARGTVLEEFDLGVQGRRTVTLAANNVFRLLSTGNITVSTWADDGFTAVPSFTGEFVGRTFYARTWVGFNGCFVVFAYQDASVSVTNLEGGRSYTAALKRGEYWYEENVGNADLIFDSTGDVAVWSGDIEGLMGIKSLGDDITFTGGKDAREFWFQAVHRKAGPAAVIFAWKDTTVELNGTVETIKADGHLDVPEGFYHLRSDESVVVETLGEDNFFNNWGTCLMAASEMAADTSMLPEPNVQGDSSLLLVGVGAAASAVSVSAIVLWFTRHRRR